MPPRKVLGDTYNDDTARCRVDDDSFTSTCLTHPDKPLYPIQAEYDQAVGLVTVLFFGTVVCTCGYRRRLATTIQLEEEEVQMQADHVNVS